jgi:deoxyribodipyrimidine photolyase-related protein
MGKRPNETEYNQLEGFVRQIIDGVSTCEEFIGWKCQIMLNFFNNQEKLPEWFWTGKQNALFKGYYKSVPIMDMHIIFSD